jgi:hypothetical protein
MRSRTREPRQASIAIRWLSLGCSCTSAMRRPPRQRSLQRQDASRDYGTLVPLAAALESAGHWTGATAVYRALLVAILDKAYTPACRHGEKYWGKLQVLARKDSGLMPLEPPEQFEARIRLQHKHKSSFWAHVACATGGDAEQDDED